MKFYFYCPKCNHEEIASSLLKHTIPNCRDGYGVPIHHYPYPNCNNPHSGFMVFRIGYEESISTKNYYKQVIKFYQL